MCFGTHVRTDVQVFYSRFFERHLEKNKQVLQRSVRGRRTSVAMSTNAQSQTVIQIDHKMLTPGALCDIDVDTERAKRSSANACGSDVRPAVRMFGLRFGCSASGSDVRPGVRMFGPGFGCL